MIDVRDLTVRYGAATALDGVGVRLEGSELVALIGPNGAGKSTLVKAIAGTLRPASGTITLGGRLAVVPEGRQLFGELTVEDNLRLGAWTRRERDPGWVYEILPDLEPMRRRPAGRLSGGQQQMVAIGRALMARPDALIIDELSLGLAPIVVTSLVRDLLRLNREHGLAVLLIEQNARLALRTCSRAYVLEAGRIVLEGAADELARTPAVARVYLGGSVGQTDGDDLANGTRGRDPSATAGAGAAPGAR